MDSITRPPARPPARRVEPRPIELLPPAWAPRRRTRWPWQPFAAAPVLAWLVVHGGPLGLVLGSLGIVGVFAWIDRWIAAQGGGQ